jgi:hypothetical protein
MDDDSIYGRNTIEFLTVALEYCSFAETVNECTLLDFVDKATKILPLLYLKAALLPEIIVEDEDESCPAPCITEEMYNSVCSRIADFLREKDSYLETFHPDMPFSDAPVAAFVSEDLADIYQDTGNFCFLFRQGNEDVMRMAVAACRTNFREYWGQRLLNALKALHAVRYNEDDRLETPITE